MTTNLKTLDNLNGIQLLIFDLDNDDKLSFVTDINEDASDTEHHVYDEFRVDIDGVGSFAITKRVFDEMERIGELSDDVLTRVVIVSVSDFNKYCRVKKIKNI